MTHVWLAARLAVLTVPTTLPGGELLVVALCTVFLLKSLPSINQLPALDLLLRLVEISLDVDEVVRRERERVIVWDVLQSTNVKLWIVLLVGVPSSIDGRTVDQSHDAGEETGDPRDSLMYRVELEAGDEVDLRWRDLRLLIEDG